MNSLAFVIVALFIVAFALISARLQQSIVSAPMVFVAFGVLLAVSPMGGAEFRLEEEWLNLLAELTLVLVLFTDAARIDLRSLRLHHAIPVRLLTVGLPLTIGLGALVAIGLLPLTILEACVLAAILAPTDAALGQAVVNNPGVPVRIRQALNVESGLNDGIALPFVLMFLALVGATGESQQLGYWARFGAAQLLLGPLVGIAVGYTGGKAIARGTRSGWISPAFQRLASIGLAVLAYAGAELVTGNGFIAAFCAGVVVGNTARGICDCLFEFAEAEGQLLTLLTFLFFGVALVIPALEQTTVACLLYAALSLTVVRLAPVALSLLGKRLRWETQFFIGWFGPRGIASILYALIVLRTVEFPGREVILVVVVLTVLISVVAHGVTAWPASVWYARRTERHLDPAMPERVEVPEMPVRSPWRLLD